jgi:hypothetical protein
MALALQDQNLVWQKVAKALDVQVAGTSGTSANPASQNVFKGLKLQLSTQQIGPQLQFVPFSYANLTGASGYQFGISGAFHLYGVWAKKTGTGVTGAYLACYDSESGAVASAKFATYMSTGVSGGGSGDEVAFTWPLGLAFATDVTIISQSTYTGVTAITGAGDIINGFAIIGA